MGPTDSGTQDWWEDFFKGPFGEMQVAGLREDRAAEEVAFMETVLDLSPPATVLDVPCGAGRHTIELAAKGYAVTGVDFNEAVLERARTNASERGVSVQLLCGDMRSLTFDEQYDAAICPWGSFGYFDEAGDRSFAEGAFRSLRPQGRFLIDTPTVETIARFFSPRGWSWWGEGGSGVRVLEEREWNLQTGRLDVTWSWVGKGTISTRRSSLRIYTYREVCDLLRGVGFRSFAGFDTITGKPFGMGSNRLTVVATK